MILIASGLEAKASNRYWYTVLSEDASVIVESNEVPGASGTIFAMLSPKDKNFFAPLSL